MASGETHLDARRLRLWGSFRVGGHCGSWLRRADGQTDTVFRNDIEDDGIVNTTKSLMPEGLEKNLSFGDMADLLAFLKRWRETE
jgi:hypothetical protein